LASLANVLNGNGTTYYFDGTYLYLSPRSDLLGCTLIEGTHVDITATGTGLP
jgi:hypothetical protein